MATQMSARMGKLAMVAGLALAGTLPALGSAQAQPCETSALCTVQVDSAPELTPEQVQEAQKMRDEYCRAAAAKNEPGYTVMGGICFESRVSTLGPILL
ncbi:hypothetical protein [Streptomyces sp. NPDC018352]|uniref:hypothetical protein n=1 Tax=Streptomyces sp. NPDC018352 TaxID=3157194 RepID=UPI0033EA2DAA